MTATGPPAGINIWIEFTPGTWTDVTPWLDQEPFTVKIGRTSEFSAPSVGTLDGVHLDNSDGRFTPACQVLVDGTANPYYPNVEPLRRIRYSNTPMGVRFVGRIQGWPPLVDGVGGSWVVLSATDALDRPLAHVTLASPIAQVVADDKPRLLWACTEPVGALAALEGGGQAPLTLTGAGAPVLFGEPGPGVGDGTGVRFAPTAANAGQYLMADTTAVGYNYSPTGAYTVECWVNAGTSRPAWAATGEVILNMMQPSHTAGTQILLVGGFPQLLTESGSLTGPASISDGGWHHLLAMWGAGTYGSSFAIDGLWVGAEPGIPGVAQPFVDQVCVGSDSPSMTFNGLHGRFQGSVGYVAAYLHLVPLGLHVGATNGFAGDTTGARVTRWLTSAGLTAADWSVAAGKEVVGTYPQAGKTVAAACQDMAVTEGAGAAFYAAPTGLVTFVNRDFRKPGPPTLTLDASADLDAGSYQPSYDALTLANSSKVSRAASSGNLSEQSWTDQGSVDKFGPSDDSVTSYATTDPAALRLAQSRVGRNAWPGFRLGQVGVDLVTATNDLYAAAAAVRIGSRIRVGGLPAALSPTTQVDVIAEGWTETVSLTSYVMVFDTTAADNPARAVWDDPTYGRWQCSGQLLNAAITKTATTIVIATLPGLPTFTMVAARYPVDIRVEREVLTLTGPPDQAATPQTFAGCLRGQKGTPAAAQASGAVVNLSPAVTFTL